MTIEELYELIESDESYRIERTVSTGNMDKFQEAICAFANDLSGSRKKGFLLRDDEKSYEESVHSVSLNVTCTQLKANLNSDEKLLINWLYGMNSIYILWYNMEQKEQHIVYHDRMHIIADEQIAFDLDDGVVVNYAKFGDALSKLK